MGLTGEDETGFDLVFFQRIVDFHIDLALDQLGAAGATDAALTGKGQVRPLFQRRIKDILAAHIQIKIKLVPVNDDGNIAHFSGKISFFLGTVLCCALGSGRRSEQLIMDIFSLLTALFQGI